MISRQPLMYIWDRAVIANRPAAPDWVANREIGSPRGVTNTIEGLTSGHTAHVEKASPRY